MVGRILQKKWDRVRGGTEKKTDFTTPQARRFEICVLKATIENKTTSVTTYFKKLTKGNNVLLSHLLSKVMPHPAVFTQMYNCPPCCRTTHS